MHTFVANIQSCVCVQAHAQLQAAHGHLKGELQQLQRQRSPPVPASPAPPVPPSPGQPVPPSPAAGLLAPIDHLTGSFNSTLNSQSNGIFGALDSPMVLSPALSVGVPESVRLLPFTVFLFPPLSLFLSFFPSRLALFLSLDLFICFYSLLALTCTSFTWLSLLHSVLVSVLLVAAVTMRSTCEGAGGPEPGTSGCVGQDESRRGGHGGHWR